MIGDDWSVLSVQFKTERSCYVSSVGLLLSPVESELILISMAVVTEIKRFGSLASAS